MIAHKYHSLFMLCLAGLLLSIFAPRRMRQYYPTEFCREEKVQFYCFARHSWLMKRRLKGK